MKFKVKIVGRAQACADLYVEAQSERQAEDKAREFVKSGGIWKQMPHDRWKIDTSPVWKRPDIEQVRVEFVVPI